MRKFKKEEIFFGGAVIILIFVLIQARGSGLYGFSGAGETDSLKEAKPLTGGAWGDVATGTASKVLKEVFRPLQDWMKKYSTPKEVKE